MVDNGGNETVAATETADTPARGETSQSDGGALGRGLGLSAGAAILFLLLRLMAVSGWDWDTAFRIADVVDFGDSIPIVFGTLFAQPLYTGILIMWLLPLTVLRLVFPLQGRRFGTVSDILLLAVLLACGISLTRSHHEWWLLVGAALIAAAMVSARLSPHGGAIRRGAIAVLGSIGPTAIAGALVLATVVSTPWTPLEIIETETETINGYVIKVESGYLRVLVDDPREMIIIMGNEVVSRT